MGPWLPALGVWSLPLWATLLLCLGMNGRLPSYTVAQWNRMQLCSAGENHRNPTFMASFQFKFFTLFFMWEMIQLLSLFNITYNYGSWEKKSKSEILFHVTEKHSLYLLKYTACPERAKQVLKAVTLLLCNYDEGVIEQGEWWLLIPNPLPCLQSCNTYTNSTGVWWTNYM